MKYLSLWFHNRSTGGAVQDIWSGWPVPGGIKEPGTLWCLITLSVSAKKCPSYKRWMPVCLLVDIIKCVHISDEGSWRQNQRGAKKKSCFSWYFYLMKLNCNDLLWKNSKTWIWEISTGDLDAFGVYPVAECFCLTSLFCRNTFAGWCVFSD